MMIAVLMSVYKNDRLEYLKQAVDSVLAQTYETFYLYIMADGLVDDDIDIYLKSLDAANIKYLKRSENKGLAHTLNELVDLVLHDTKYNYFARMDADDICFPERFAEQMAFFNSHPKVDVLGGWCEEIDENGKFIFLKKMNEDDENIKLKMVVRNPFNHPTVMIRRKVFEDGYRYSTKAFLAEDYALWVELAANGYVFANIPKPLIKFRISGDFFERRRGIKRAIADINIKSYAIICLDAYTVANVANIFFSFILRMMPAPILKILYYKLR